MEPVFDDGVIITRVAALDVGNAEVVCCVRVPGVGADQVRCQVVRSFATMTRSLLELADWLHQWGVTRVVVEATSDYWKPPFYVLEAAGSTPGWSTPRTSNISRPAQDRPVGRGPRLRVDKPRGIGLVWSALPHSRLG